MKGCEFVKQVLSIFIFCVLLVGCSTPTTTNKTECFFLTAETTTRLTFISEGDAVQQEQMELTMSTESFLEIESSYHFLKDINGVDFSTVEEGIETTIRILIDYTLVDLQTLVDLGIIASDASEIGTISLNQAVSELEANGVTCLRNQ